MSKSRRRRQAAGESWQAAESFRVPKGQNSRVHLPRPQRALALLVVNCSRVSTIAEVQLRRFGIEDEYEVLWEASVGVEDYH